MGKFKSFLLRFTITCLVSCGLVCLGFQFGEESGYQDGYRYAMEDSQISANEFVRWFSLQPTIALGDNSMMRDCQFDLLITGDGAEIISADYADNVILKGIYLTNYYLDPGDTLIFMTLDREGNRYYGFRLLENKDAGFRIK